jgi:flagellar basal-body rod protein FlgB
MDPDGIGFFNLAERRLSWINQRQGLLAQNIANADTPKFNAHDLIPFAQLLESSGRAMSKTNPMHISSMSASVSNLSPRPNERAPDGNAVSVEEQLTKIADSEGAQSLTINLMHKYIGLFRIVLGK